MNFSFQLTGKKWFGLYLTLIVFYFIPVIAMQFISARLKTDPNDFNTSIMLFCLFLVIMVTMLLITVPIAKLFMQNSYLNNKSFSFTGTTSEYVWLNIKGILLSIITLGIYYPWYITNITTFFIGKSAYNETPFTFHGKAIAMFKIMLLFLVLPMIAYVIVFVTYFKAQANDPIFAVVSQIVVMLLIIPYLVYFYNWLINISFKSFTIQWDTPLMQTMSVLFREFFLTVITAGIYFPVALAKISRLFALQTYIYSDGKRVFQCDANYNYLTLWKTVWIQVILTIITCSIYGAWAYCNIARAYINPISVVKV